MTCVDLCAQGVPLGTCYTPTMIVLLRGRVCVGQVLGVLKWNTNMAWGRAIPEYIARRAGDTITA